MTIQALAMAFLSAITIGGLAWVFLYPSLSGERKAEQRRASFASAEPIARRGERNQRTRREQVEDTLKEVEQRHKKAQKIPITTRIAQAGLSWDTILRKRENYRKAFDGFDVNKVARYTDKKVEKLLQDEGIIRNRLKIASAISNARAFLAVQNEFGSFDKYIWSFVDGKPIVNRLKESSQVPAKTEVSDAISKDLKKRGFNFVGSTIMYAFMQATGMVNDHLVSCFRYKEV